jgi:phage tail-like protein
VAETPIGLRAGAGLRGVQADLGWSWREPGPRPALRVLRGAGTYPEAPEEGIPVLDVAELFREPEAPWDRIVRLRYLTPPAPLPWERDSAGGPPRVRPLGVDGGVLQAEVALFFAAAADGEPARVVVRVWNAATGALGETGIDEVVRVERTSAPAGAPWASIESLEVFATPGGGPEQLMGEVEVAHAPAPVFPLDPDAPAPPPTGPAGRFTWRMSGVAPVAVELDAVQVLVTTVQRDPLAGGAQRFRWATRHRTAAVTVADALLPDPAAEADPTDAADPRDLPGAPVVRALRLEETPDPDLGATIRHFTLEDRGLTPHVPRYYTFFRMDQFIPGGWETGRTWRAAATPTARYGFAERMYALLPAVHARYDEPEPGDRGRGQLRRFLKVFGAAADQLRGFAESLRLRHDARHVRADLLPRLSRWIGWDPDLTSTVQAQRRDLEFAPEIFATVGTLPNVRALVNRVTGWEVRTREFVHSVFLTNAPEEVPHWELFHQRLEAGVWSDPELLLPAESFEGRPAGVVLGGQTWLFWHSEAEGRRELWLTRPGVDPAPRRVMLDAPDDAPGAAWTDEDPTAVVEGGRIQLFWSSNRDGRWNLWTRELDGLPAGPAQRLTDHAATDRRPAAAVDGLGRTWLFWESNRRGPTDIWAQVREGGAWGPPFRVTTAERRDEHPAAVVDGAGRIWLFWSSDSGDRRTLRYQVLEGAMWSPARTAVEQPPEPARDESPAALVAGGEVWLFWHSDRGIGWNVWAARHPGADPADGFGAPFVLSRHPEADKDPAVLDEGGTLHLVWRSQRRAMRYRSRTLDTADPAVLEALGQFHDRSHYTYDTAKTNDDWYARDTVGLYLSPDTDDAERINREVNRVSSFVEPFRPLPVRYVWMTDTPVVLELMDVGNLVDEGWTDTME